jgi:hypothetical protein
MNHGAITGRDSEAHGQRWIELTQTPTGDAPRHIVIRQFCHHDPNERVQIGRPYWSATESAKDGKSTTTVHLYQSHRVSGVQLAHDVSTLTISSREPQD